LDSIGLSWSLFGYTARSTVWTEVTAAIKHMNMTVTAVQFPLPQDENSIAQSQRLLFQSSRRLSA